jgi:hypothetical protein
MRDVSGVLRRAVAPALAVMLCGCAVKAQPVRAVGLNRASPKATYEYLLTMVRAMQVEAEWQAFSPAFKRRLSQGAGRTVDFGDYSHARATIAGNDTREIRAFLESEYVGETPVSDREVLVTIRSGSRELRARMVKIASWEVVLQGEEQPVAGFLPGLVDVVGITPDGHLQVRVIPEESSRSFLKDVPNDRIQSMTLKWDWYVDEIGGVEDAVRGGLRGRGDRADVPRDDPVPVEPPPGPPAPPPAWEDLPPPMPPLVPEPAPTPGIGSPDG